MTDTVMTTATCAYPACARPVEEGPGGTGRKRRYCDLIDHNAQSAFAARRTARTAGADVDEPTDLGRPASLAGERLHYTRDELMRLLADSAAHTEALAADAIASLTDATDPTTVETELAWMRADTARQIAEAAQRVAEEQRLREDAEPGLAVMS